MRMLKPPIETVCPAGCSTSPPVVFALAGRDVRRCGGCGLYLLETQAGLDTAAQLDRSKFDDAFRELRSENYGHILDAVGRVRGLSGARVLDVGCSSGWFLAAAARRGSVCYGIEPDRYFYERARRALPGEVRLVNGFFDADLPGDWPMFDLITFHDVFEHLDDPLRVLDACTRRLAPRGLLVLSVPSADGFVFRLGLALRRLGSEGPLARAFQVHYPFPHLYYFARRSLETLVRLAGFDVVRMLPLRGFRLRGSLRRAQMDRADGGAGRLAGYANGAALAAFALLQPVVPADNIVAILRRKTE